MARFRCPTSSTLEDVTVPPQTATSSSKAARSRNAAASTSISKTRSKKKGKGKTEAIGLTRAESMRMAIKKDTVAFKQDIRGKGKSKGKGKQLVKQSLKNPPVNSAWSWVFVGDLPADVDRPDLVNLFKEVGKVTKVDIRWVRGVVGFDRPAHLPPPLRYAVVGFANATAAHRALELTGQLKFSERDEDFLVISQTILRIPACSTMYSSSRQIEQPSTVKATSHSLKRLTTERTEMVLESTDEFSAGFSLPPAPVSKHAAPTPQPARRNHQLFGISFAKTLA